MCTDEGTKKMGHPSSWDTNLKEQHPQERKVDTSSLMLCFYLYLRPDNIIVAKEI